MAWIIITASPLASLSVKLIAPYTNAPLCCGEDKDKHMMMSLDDIAEGRISPFVMHASMSYRLIGDEIGGHGERYDQNSGWPRPQEHSGPIHALSHALIKQHPAGEGHNQQQAHKVGELHRWEERHTVNDTGCCFSLTPLSLTGLAGCNGGDQLISLYVSRWNKSLSRPHVSQHVIWSAPVRKKVSHLLQ